MEPYEKLDGDIKAFVREWEHLVFENAKALKKMGEENMLYVCLKRMFSGEARTRLQRECFHLEDEKMTWS
eukprot:Awhi_evm1s11132